MAGLGQWAVVRRFGRPVRAGLGAGLRETYSRNLHKWLVIAPVVGVLVGVTIAGVAEVLLRKLWPVVLRFYLAHPWAMLPGLVVGCAVAGLLMQFGTGDPNEHSTEEVIRSYHEHEGRLDLRWAPAKLLAAIATVGSGGSAALEGPSIYGGAAVGVWVWERLRVLRRAGWLQRFQLTVRERRVLLICGAAAGMSAVFRAPLTGIVFALEMPYKDDLAHEALLPSLIASVVSYMTLGAFLGSEPLFRFATTGTYGMRELWWSGVLGAGVGLVAMGYVIGFRHLRGWVVRQRAPHWVKLAVGGLVTGLCGWVFLRMYPAGVGGQAPLVPLGPNYEAVNQVVNGVHTTAFLLLFAAFKLLATAATLGAGGVSAMFVPLFLTGGGLGVAFGQAVVHAAGGGGAVELYAAVGMASFLAAAYKTPLAAVVFVAEATGGHAFLIPALVGAAVAYAISGDASVSGDQRVREGAVEEGVVLPPEGSLAPTGTEPAAG